MQRLLSTLLFLFGLGALALVVYWLTTSERTPPAPPERPPYVLPVTLAEVTRGELAPSLLLTGSVVASEHSALGFRLGGSIVALGAREGTEVEAGSVLARLSEQPHLVALARAQAALALAQRELELAQAGVRVEERARLAAELEQRRAEAELAHSEVERNRPLAGTDVITASRLDSLEAAARAADAIVEAAQQDLAAADAGTRPEELAIRRAQVALRESEVAIAEVELEKTYLRAPFTASVVSKLASLGETVAAGAPVYELVDLSSLEVALEVPAAYAPHVREGAAVELTLDDVPDYRLRAVLDAVIVFADEDSRNFRALVRLGNELDPKQVLKPGMFVRARVTLAPIAGALLVPSDALREVEQGTIVVRAAPGPASEQGGPSALGAEWVAVRVLGSSAGQSAIEALSGELTSQDSVVITGVDLAFPGVSLMPIAGAPQGTPPSDGEEPR